MALCKVIAKVYEIFYEITPGLNTFRNFSLNVTILQSRYWHPHLQARKRVGKSCLQLAWLSGAVRIQTQVNALGCCHDTKSPAAN